MTRTLIAVDGSEYAQRAVEYMIAERARYKDPPAICLVTVQMPIVGVNVKIFISQDALNDYYREQGMAALAPARALLDAAAVPYDHHIGVGDPGTVIVEYSKAKDCDHIVMGCRGLGALGGLMLGSVATKVARLSELPITLV